MSLVLPLDGVREGESVLVTETPAASRCKGTSTTLSKDHNAENNCAEPDDNLAQDTQVTCASIQTVKARISL